MIIFHTKLEPIQYPKVGWLNIQNGPKPQWLQPELLDTYVTHLKSAFIMYMYIQIQYIKTM